MGYRGHDYQGQATVHVDKRGRVRTPRPLWRWMKRRAAVEPSIGHLKNEHRLERNRLRGTYSDAINAVLAAAAMNFHELPGAFGFIFCADCWESETNFSSSWLLSARRCYVDRSEEPLFQDRLATGSRALRGYFSTTAFDRFLGRSTSTPRSMAMK